MAYLGSSTGRADGSADTVRASGSVSSRAGRGARGSGALDREPAGSAAHEGSRRAPRGIGRSYAEERDWRRLATFGGGIALGALLGAGVALLFAPAAGEETRELLLDHARSAGGRVRDRFDDLRDEVRFATRRGRRGMRRGLARGGWALEDAMDRVRRRR